MNKIAFLLVLVFVIQGTFAKSAHDYSEFVTDLKKPAIASVVNQLLGGFQREDVIELGDSKLYDIVRTGVGCVAGVSGGLDTAFTIADIIQSDPTDPGVYIFAVIFTIAWWQQNGQYIEYMCGNFWILIN